LLGSTLRERADDFVGNGGRDGRGATVKEISNLCHEATLGRNPPGRKNNSLGKNPVAEARN